MAVSLVLQAYTVGEHGDVLVLDMGKPIRILDLAKTLIRLSGKSEEEIGLPSRDCVRGRSCRKNCSIPAAEQLPTPSRKVKRTHSQLMSWRTLRKHLGDLAALAGSGSDESIREKVKAMIPEYQYAPEVHAPLEPQAGAAGCSAAGPGL